jgi:hypothetical protein
MSELVNKVAQSGIITIDPADYYPNEEITPFDLKDYLYMGLILKEKEFREALKNIDPTIYSGKIIAVHCTADAIIPVWAYMLVASLLQPFCSRVLMGDKETAIKNIMVERISAMDDAPLREKRIVIKGCGDLPIPAEAYLELTARLRPIAKSIMYGEPCSTVPVFKKKEES